jgi:hypothetical protein
MLATAALTKKAIATDQFFTVVNRTEPVQFFMDHTPQAPFRFVDKPNAARLSDFGSRGYAGIRVRGKA